MNNRNLVLCGFMGSGKTTVGKLLAKKLGRTFVDMDAYIENAAGMTVSRIFETQGEPSFRQMESKAAKELSEAEGLVVATGGGALLNPKNQAAFSENGVIILLEVTPETVLRRLKNDLSRPLLARPDKERVIRELMEQRIPVYRASARIIVDGNGSAEQVLAEIAEKLEKMS